MPVKITLIGFGGRPTVTFVDGTSVLDVLRNLGGQAPRDLVEAGAEAGAGSPAPVGWRLATGLVARLNGRDIRFLRGLATPVTDGDEVAVMVPLIGG